MTMEDDDDRFRALTSAVEELRTQREQDRMMIEELLLAMASAPGLPPTATSAEHVYPDWISWVDEWLTVRISRRPQRVRWCSHYAEHPEVADRLEALWHVWEVQWPEPEARLSWFRDGLDQQLPLITADDGPLRECSAIEDQHVLPTNLAAH